MRRLSRGQRIAVALWVLVAAVFWNGVYDLRLLSSTREYLFRHALHEAGRGPAVDLSQAMAAGVRDAAWLATLAACTILLAAMLTVRMKR
ncbi:MAG TPA: hypothetical protein VD833_10720 [Vicinamibacterales bacterium]|nr:hypothetical protein [Vicinamibacterales bacterium]